MPAQESCRREVEITIPWDQVEQEIKQVVNLYRKQARIPGFRPGKASPAVIRRRFWGDIKQEVIEKLIPKLFWEETRKQDLKVVGSPDVSNLHFEEGDPLRFHAEFDVLPEFELGDYKRVEVPFSEPEVEDEDVDKELERLREEHATFQNLDPRPLEEGDIAVVSLRSAPLPDTPRIEQEDMAITMGADDTLPEFTENLLGKAPGEEVDFEVHYPDDFGNDKLAGKTLPFHTVVKGIRRKELPELDDEFAADIGDFKSLDDLRGRIREAIGQSRRHAATEAAKNKLVDALLEMHDFPAPEALVEQQIETRIERRLRSLAEQGVDPSKLDLDWNRLRETEREYAVRDVRAGLLLERIAQAENIAAGSEEIEEQIRRYAAHAKQTAAAARAKLAEDGSLDRLQVRIRNEKTLNFLFDEALKVDQEVGA